ARLDVTVSTAAEAGNAVISVSDTGTGVAEGEIDRLLRPFERGDSARSGSTGAGLGLPIVERVARMHGGSLSLEAAGAHGLRAVLRLPRSDLDRVPAS
ncbi:MAG: sensor histidine kinase, partial [Burkholderiaceae bacterium]